MTPDVQVRSAQVPDAHSFLPDEAALRRSYDAHADDVAASAAKQLGEAAHLAPKVVEHVFLNVWRSRGRITSDAELTAFLENEVKHDSARVLSRRMAAQRLGTGGSDKPRRNGHHEHEVQGYDRERSWEHLVREIRGSDADAAHARAAAIGHHEAAAHIAEVGHDRGWVRPVLTGALVLGAALGGIWVLDYASRGAKLDAAVMSTSARMVEARPGQIGAMTLDEGSRVRFAPESQVYIPQEFGPELRGIRVVGAASVEVAPGLEASMVVKVKEAFVTAEGTAFTVRAFPGDSLAVVAVSEGKVTVRRGDEERALAAGEAISIPDSSAMRTPTRGELEEATAWTRNRLEVHDRRLADALPEFLRWYNMRVFVADTRIHDRRVTISASLDSVRQAIADVEESGSVKFGYIEDKMVFTDAAAAAAKASKR